MNFHIRLNNSSCVLYFWIGLNFVRSGNQLILIFMHSEHQYFMNETKWLRNKKRLIVSIKGESVSGCLMEGQDICQPDCLICGEKRVFDNMKPS